MLDLEQEMSRCRVCPRKCGANREHGKTGYCKAPSGVAAARAALHFWEEPCISGTTGSGTVFFSGCNLRCVYCQNHHIAEMESGKVISIGRLSDIFLELQAQNANNINLVALDGLIDIYLTDFKYMVPSLAKAYSRAEDYPETAKRALAEMVRQTGRAVFDENGLMKKGVIVRHLLLPGAVKNAKAVVKYVYETYGDTVWLSLMSQYTPLLQVENISPLNRKTTKREYERLLDYTFSLGVTNAFLQEGPVAEESFIPEFDGRGI